jgi:hypothetical protein
MSMMLPLELDLESSAKGMAGYFSEYELIEHRTNNESVLESSIFTIVLKNSSDYTNLSESYLQVNFRLVAEADNTALGTARTTLANGISSMFSRLTVRVNGQVSEVVERCDLASLVRGTVLYSQDYAANATNFFYYKNRGNGNSVAAGDNAGFDSRLARTGNSLKCSAFIAMSELSGFCSVDKLLVNQEVSFEFTKSQSSEHIMAAATAGKMLVDRMSVWSPRIVLEPSADLTIKKSISSGLSSPFDFHNWSSYVSPTLNSGQGNYRVITTSEEVNYVYVGVRKANGTQVVGADNNPQRMLQNWQSCEISLNGRRYPLTRYNNLQDGAGSVGSVGLARAYNGLVKSANDKTDYSNGINLTFDEFKNNQTILCFDLTAKAFNWSKSQSTIEVHYDLSAFADSQLVVTLVSKKNVMVNYQGGQAVVSIA